jgi:hypothetical protein
MPESNLNKGENTRQQMSFPNRKPTDYDHAINSINVVFDGEHEFTIEIDVCDRSSMGVAKNTENTPEKNFRPEIDFSTRCFRRHCVYRVLFSRNPEFRADRWKTLN